MKPLNKDTHSEALLLQILSESTIEVNHKITTKVNRQLCKTLSYGAKNPHLKALALLTDPAFDQSMLHSVEYQITLNLNADTIPLKPNTQIFAINKLIHALENSEYINHLTHIKGTAKDGTQQSWPISDIKSITLRLI